MGVYYRAGTDGEGMTVRIVCVGGGPGGLYAAILLKLADPGRDVVVHERNRPDDTFGFGVVFSDATLDNIRDADPATYAAITADFAHWDDIDVHFRGQVLRSTGHGFAGLSRQRLLEVLQARAEAVGVSMRFQSEVEDLAALRADLVIAADGVNSGTRQRFAQELGADVQMGANRFLWLGTTRQFPAFTFYFRENEHGLWRVHAYNYEAGRSTFIVETTDAAWRSSGMEDADEQTSADYCAALFAEELEGHPVLVNRSIWRRFPTVRCARWSHENVVLIGDAVRTAHFSVGSGTKLAMEDAIALTDALGAEPDLATALASYELARRPDSRSLQRSAAVSLKWFEDTERYFAKLEPRIFTFSLLTRSLRITHENLKLRDPAFVHDIDVGFAEDARVQSGVEIEGTPPPMFTPFRMGDLVVPNRVVLSPMCQYCAEDGVPNEWHLVHLGSRAVGGAGLVMTEMTDVSAGARITPHCTGLYDDAQAAAWRRITDFVHDNSPGAIGVQLAHAGRKGSTKAMWAGIDEPLDDGNWPILAPSPLPYFPHSQVPRAMDQADLAKVRDDFVGATRRAEAAGFDLVELHFAHGYLLATFLSPLTNQRTDAYGGSLEGRMRFPLEVFDAVRDAWPAGKPVAVRISATDWIRGGATTDDAVALAAALKARGCDIVDVSSGLTTPESVPEYGRLYQTPFAERIRQEVGVPTMTVGNISSYADVNSVLAAGRADLCVIARAHLFDPYWTRHAAFEQGVELPWPKQYGVLGGYVPRMEWSPRGQAKG